LGILTNAPTAPVTVSSATTALPTPTAATVLHLGGATGQACRETLDSFGGTSNAAAQFGFRTARGSAAAPSAVQSGDQIGGIIWDAYGSSSYSAGAGAGYMIVRANENWTDAHQGSRMEFAVVQTGGVGAGVAMTIDPSAGTTESVDAGVSTRRLTRPFKSLTNNSATTIFSLTVANNTQIAVELQVCSECTDGTNMQVSVDRWIVSGYNKAGVITMSIDTGLQTVHASSGTLSRTLTVSNANPAVVQINVNSSLTPSANYPRVTITIENYTRQAIGSA
jgi:hypothetical protein